MQFEQHGSQRNMQFKTVAWIFISRIKLKQIRTFDFNLNIYNLECLIKIF